LKEGTEMALRSTDSNLEMLESVTIPTAAQKDYGLGFIEVVQGAWVPSKVSDERPNHLKRVLKRQGTPPDEEGELHPK
jgi:hypothetical protein